MKPAIIIPAAGLSSRMGNPQSHKLLSLIGGKTMIHRACTVALQVCNHTYLVTGHRALEIKAEVADLALQVLYNSNYASGMSASLKLGIEAVDAAGHESAMILLPDMPFVMASDLEALFAAHRQHPHAVIRATANGQPGNPVILPKVLFDAVKSLSGDIGARKIIAQSGCKVIDVEIGAAALCDLDTPQAIRAAGGSPI